MSSDVVVRAKGLGKAYLIYQKPEDRLKQMFLRSYKKLYREFWAFQNVDLQIRRGETVGIIGRNGSGKSTLLQVIAGTLKPNSGTINVRGRVAPLLELGAGFNPEFTGRENVKLAGSVLGLSGEQIQERFEDILDFAGIGEFIDQPVKSYSSGMYARLAFAVAAHVDADILIADEILAVGDAAFVQKCMRWIRKFKENGTLLFVSHDTAAVNALCDRAVWMDKGQIRAEGPAKDVGFEYNAALREEADGDGFKIAGRRRQEPVKRLRQDFRHAAIHNSDKRNILEVFEFDPNAFSFGRREGTVTEVKFLSSNGDDLPILNGGEDVTLEIRCRAEKEMNSPIVGFFVRDRLGQNLFGDNTYLNYAEKPLIVPQGGEFMASFSFQIPYLPAGDYSVTVALASGSEVDHVHHHWIDEALLFHAEGGHHRHGLIGIPMHRVSLQLSPNEPRG